MEGDNKIVRPVAEPRPGWDERFRRMAEHGDDALLDGEAFPATSWDESEWVWELPPSTASALGV